MRQTGLSFDALKGYFDRTHTLPYKHCLLISEVGDVARTGEEHSAEAQKILVELLGSAEKNDRWMAIRILLDTKRIGIATPETIRAIDKFSALAENSDILPPPTPTRSATVH